MPEPVYAPQNIIAPHDDGAAQHLADLRLPDITLPSTNGQPTNLSKLKGRSVFFIYPRTRAPNAPSLDGWDSIPGARGCTLQCGSFRDLANELRVLGVSNLFGISTQDSEYQREVVERLRLPFPLLSDQEMLLSKALKLPTFVTSGFTLLKRMAWIVDDDKIKKIFYPAFPPEKNAEEVVMWLRSSTEVLP